jgi:tetratricopeptide (TPR) repeat protein
MLRRALLLSLATLPAAAQAPPSRPARTPAETLDLLFAALKAAPDESVATQIEARIWQAWIGQGSPAVQLLLRRGMRNIEARALTEALEDFDAVIALAPDLAEGWNKRATVYFLMQQDENSAKDILETLTREPRHFGALQGLSLVRERQNDLPGALRAFEAALALHPKMAGGADRLRALRRRALGEDL